MPTRVRGRQDTEMTEIDTPAPAKAGSPDPQRVLEGTAKALTILAVALPAIGALIRWLSYGLAGLPPELAVALSIPGLAVAAVRELYFVLLINLPLILLSAWIGACRE